MFNDELKKLLVEVITSWQVIAVTIVLVLYVFLVNYVARLYHRRPPGRAPKPKAASSRAETPAIAPESDGLGLEEEDPENT